MLSYDEGSEYYLPCTLVSPLNRQALQLHRNAHHNSSHQLRAMPGSFSLYRSSEMSGTA